MSSGGLFFIMISISAVPCYARQQHYTTDTPPIFTDFYVTLDSGKQPEDSRHVTPGMKPPLVN